MATFKKTCNHCGEMIKGDSKFCPACTSASPFRYSCPACRREISRNDSACAGCGRDIYITCPDCEGMAFVGDTKCELCYFSLMVPCSSSRCGKQQFFQNKKCTECGVKIKKRGIF